MFVTAHSVRDVVSRMAPGQLFCTREMLHLGSRSAVDVSLSRLVKDGMLVRYARGVFARPPTGDKAADEPSVRDVAEIKARAFGKSIMCDSSEAMQELNIKIKIGRDIVFRVSGVSSKFRFKGTYVHLRAACSRKMQMGDSRLGKLLRALWSLGRNTCERSRELFAVPLTNAVNVNNQKIAAWPPAWLQRILFDWEPRLQTRIQFRPV